MQGCFSMVKRDFIIKIEFLVLFISFLIVIPPVTDNNNQLETVPLQNQFKLNSSYSQYSINYTESISGVVFYNMALDDNGSQYLVGITSSTNLQTVNAYQKTNAGGQDVVVAKFNNNGKLEYLTYLGSSGTESASFITVDKSGDAIIGGQTAGPYTSSQFPTTNNAYQKTGGNDAFITKLNSTGNGLIFSTFLGGATTGIVGITLDDNGSIYVAGSTSSTNFPLVNAYDTSPGPGFISKLSSDGSTLLYSTYFSADPNDIKLDSTNNIIITGEIISGVSGGSIPVTPFAFQGSSLGGNDGFLTKFAPNGTTLIFSTFLSGSGSDVGVSLKIDSQDNIIVAGTTTSTDFPVQNPLVLNNTASSSISFVGKFSPKGNSLSFLTYLDSTGGTLVPKLALDPTSNICSVGSIPVSDTILLNNSFQDFNKGGYEGYISCLSSNGQDLPFSSYIGGSANDFVEGVQIDNQGNIYLTGYTESLDFPGLQPPITSTYWGFVVKISQTPTITPTAPTINPVSNESYTSNTEGQVLNWTITDANPNSYMILRNNSLVASGLWASNIQITYTLPNLPNGMYNYTIIAYDVNGLSTIATRWITVAIPPSQLNPSIASIQTSFIPSNSLIISVQLTNTTNLENGTLIFTTDGNQWYDQLLTINTSSKLYDSTVNGLNSGTNITYQVLLFTTDNTTVKSSILTFMIPKTTTNTQTSTVTDTQATTVTNSNSPTTEITTKTSTNTKTESKTVKTTVTKTTEGFTILLVVSGIGLLILQRKNLKRK